jgi:hypothetical protein
VLCGATHLDKTRRGEQGPAAIITSHGAAFADGRGAVPPNPAGTAPAGMIRLPTASVIVAEAESVDGLAGPFFIRNPGEISRPAECVKRCESGPASDRRHAHGVSG